MKRERKTNKAIIVVERGFVTDAFSSDRNLKIEVIDLDENNCVKCQREAWRRSEKARRNKRLHNLCIQRALPFCRHQ